MRKKKFEALMSMINKMSANISFLEQQWAILKDPTRHFITKDNYKGDMRELNRRIDETESKATHGFYTHTALLEKLKYHFAGPIEELQRTQKKIMEMIKNE